MSEFEVKFCARACACGKAVIWFAQLHLHISWQCISVVMGICNEEAKAVRAV